MRRKPGYVLLALILIGILAVIVVPVVDRHEAVSAGTRTAVVDGVHANTSGPVRDPDDYTADVHLDDGTAVSVYLGGAHPDPGDAIEVYWKNDRWLYAKPYGWRTVLVQVVLLAGLAGALVGWFRVRRRPLPERLPFTADDDPCPRRGPTRGGTA